MSFALEGFSAFKEEGREEDRRSINREKGSNLSMFSRTICLYLCFSDSSNVKKTKPMQSDHCPLVDGTQKLGTVHYSGT